MGVGRFLFLVVKQFEKGEARKSAAQLTFVTLFAIVPLMASGYVIASWLPWSSSFSELFQTFIFQHFVPTSGEIIQDYLKTFSHQAKNLTWLGLIILLFSAVSLMLTIEGAFNIIWRVKSNRVGTRILVYWLILLLGPVLLAGGFLVSTYLLSSQLWMGIGGSLAKNSLLIAVLPVGLSCIALTLMYCFLPSCQIRLRHALIGAVSASLLLEAGKFAFLWLVSLSPSYEIVYGTFAMMPLFLLWLYVAWSLVLFGAQLVAMLPFYHQQWRGIKASQLDWGLTICKILQKNAHNGLTREGLIANLSFLNSVDWEPVLEALLGQGWVSNDGDLFNLHKNLEVTTVGELSELIHERRLDKLAVYQRDSDWYEQLSPLFVDARRLKSEVLNIPISQVIQS
jgi:membrane protein